MVNNRRGLSPVIATVLLIAIAIILAIIIFLWARSFVSERIEKFGEPIENSCDDVYFSAEADIDGGDLAVDILNSGNVPIYGVEVHKKSIGGSKRITSVNFGTVGSGKTGSGSGNIESSEDLTEVILLPVLVGETNEYQKQYICSEEYGVEVVL